MVVPARNAVPKPAGLSMAQAAVMGTAWLTGYRMLFVKSGLRPGCLRFDQRPEPRGGPATTVLPAAAGDGATMGTRGELADLLAFVANAGITPEIGLELPMEQAEEGFSAMLGGDTTGKIVFTR